MSKESFDKLNKLLSENSDTVDIGTPASDGLIKKAEEFLGVNFPDDYTMFLKCWGTLAIGPCEYYGISGSNFENSRVPNGIWFTSLKREQLGLPKNLIVISDNNGDEYICIDITDKNASTIVVWDVTSREVITVRAKNLFDYIIEDSEEFL